MNLHRSLSAAILPGFGLAGVAALGWFMSPTASHPSPRATPSGSAAAPAAADLGSGMATDLVAASSGAQLSPPVGVAFDQPSSNPVAPSAAGSRLAPSHRGPVLGRLPGGAANSEPVSAPAIADDSPPDRAGTDAVTVSAEPPAAHLRRKGPAAPALLVPMAAFDPTPEMPVEGAAQAALENLRQGFMAAITGPAPEGTAPPVAEVVQRWQLAQPTSDELFQLFYGEQAAQQQELKQRLLAEGETLQ